MHSNAVAAVVGMAIVMTFSAAVVPSARAGSGMDLYTRCIQSHPEIRPRESADDWIVIVQTIQTGLNSGSSPAEVAQKLVGDGVKPNDAAVEVQCALAVW
jgi:hypothetical protein